MWTLILPFTYHHDMSSIHDTFMQSHIVLDPILKTFIIEQNFPIDPQTLWCDDVIWMGSIKISKKFSKLYSLEADSDFAAISLTNSDNPPEELLAALRTCNSIELLDRFLLNTLPPWVTRYAKFGISSRSKKSSSFLSSIKSFALASRLGDLYCVLYDECLYCVDIPQELKNNYLFALTIPYRYTNNKMAESINSMCLSSVRESLLSDLPNLKLNKNFSLDSTIDSSLITKKSKTNNSAPIDKLAEYSSSFCIHCLSKIKENICNFCENIKAGHKRKFQCEWPAPLHKPGILLFFKPINF